MKTIYKLDELNIFNFCINTSKAFNNKNNKLLLFKKFLHTFHIEEEIYEETLEEYISYISFMVIKDSLIQNKNILTYEQYFFSTISGYYYHNNNSQINTKIIAKSWSNIILIFEFIITKASSPSYKNINYFSTLYSSFKHLNTKVNQSSYSLDVPLIFEKENSLDVFLILPKLKNVYYNISIPFLINYYGKALSNIYIVELDLNNIGFTFTEIENNPILINQYNKHYSSLVVDFNKINYQNCNVCPLSCTKNELLIQRYIEVPYNKRNKVIRVRNI